MAEDVIARAHSFSASIRTGLHNTINDLHSFDFNTLAVRDKKCCLKSPNMFQDLTSYQKIFPLELAEIR
jgi:hypothetical protein